MRYTINALERRRCVSQSCRFAIVVCAFWFYFRFVYSAIHFSSHFSSQVQQSFLAQHNQVSVFGWSRTLFHYFRILEILYVCTNLHSWNHHVPWISSSETILIITWRKWKLLVRFLSIMRICQILVITSKSSSSNVTIERKVLHQRYHHWSSNVS